MNPYVHIQQLSAGEFETRNDGWIHHKTVPFYIFAQAYEGHYELLDYAEGRLVCEEGGAFFTPPFVPLNILHRVNPQTGRMRIRYVHFQLADETSFDPFSVRRLPGVVSAPDANGIASAIHRLAENESAPFVREMLVMQIAAKLYSLTGPVLPEQTMPEYIRAVCLRIRAAASGNEAPACLPVGAETCRTRFYQDFRLYTGCTPQEFVRRERIRHAVEQMMREPRKSIKEIAEECGWANQYHFSRVFSRLMGVSPKIYRGSKNYQANAGSVSDLRRSDLPFND